MAYMLDTCICSYILKKRPQSVNTWFEGLGSGALCIPGLKVEDWS